MFSGQTFSWVLIPHTRLMEIQRKTQHPPRLPVTHYYPMQPLESKAGAGAGRERFPGDVCPSLPRPASTSAMMHPSRRELRHSEKHHTRPDGHFPLSWSFFSRMDQFLTYPLIIFHRHPGLREAGLSLIPGARGLALWRARILPSLGFSRSGVPLPSPISMHKPA